ncbi:prion-inhibition and propagation-domain-containing protein [Bisporella sp. PMI_857]|nr:prion-inhibition and propagation-domain-containing protein [Bisporella sp. PMI_857]
MEPISFTAGIVGLAGLFSVCLDVIDKVDSYKEFGLESRSIVAQFKADKHLFAKWAQDVGIYRSKLKNNYHTRLDNQETSLIVQEILSSIQEIFNKTESTMSNLQPVVEAGSTSFPDSIRFLNTRQKPQKSEGAISKRSAIGWSLRSKKKFIYQVQQFGGLVQRLYSLVPADGLTGPENAHNGTIGNDLSLRKDKDTWFFNSQQLLIEMEKQIEHETRKELDVWLSATWANDIYDNFIRRRLDGTCDWILSRQVFLDWISPDFPFGTTKILWINGPAGYGKTILCARVVQYLSPMLESPFAYYFCSSDSESRRDPLSIIRSWISQIILGNRDAFELAYSKWETKDGRNASQTDIVELFQTIVQQIPNCTFVVDGLDECAWPEDPTGFFESLKQAVAHTPTRILILSRDEPEIRYGFRAIWTGDNNQDLNEYKILPDDVQPDTILFSRSVVDKKLGNKSEILRNELSQRMASRCEGMFLWVKIVEEQLRSGKNKKQLEETIDQTPTALDRLYDRNWVKISNLPEKDKLRAFSILRWAAFALRPLTILEITEALLIVDDECEDFPVDELPDAIDEDYVRSEILGLCGSLLETRKAVAKQDLGLMTIHLAHFSVKQYILCHMPVQEGLLMDNERLRASSETFQNNLLAKLCLRYLNFRSVWRESSQFQIDLARRPFQDYAAGSWHHHTREGGSNYKEVVELTNALFSSNSGNWESWKKWFDINDDKSKMPDSQKQITSTNPLFYASFLGLRDTVIYLLEEMKLDVNYVDRFKRTALQAAALNGRTSIVKLLLEKEADVSIENKEGWTPLNSASNCGHKRMDALELGILQWSYRRRPAASRQRSRRGDSG